MSKHLFTDEYDTYVATSLDAVPKLYLAHVGSPYEDSAGSSFVDEWYQMEDDEVVRLRLFRLDFVGNNSTRSEKVAGWLLDALLRRGERTGWATAVLNRLLERAVGRVSMNGWRLPAATTWAQKGGNVIATATAGEWAAACEPGFFSSTEW